MTYKIRYQRDEYPRWHLTSGTWGVVGATFLKLVSNFVEAKYKGRI